VSLSTFDGNSAFVDGGAMTCSGGNPVISNTTFVSNIAGESGGAIRISNGCYLRVIDSIASLNQSNDGGAIACESGSMLELATSDFLDNSASWEGNSIRNDDRSASLIANSYFCGGVEENHIEGLWIDKGGNDFQQDCIVTADIDGNGIVNGADLLILLAHWGTCLDSCEGDLNENDVVDGADLLILLANWTG